MVINRKFSIQREGRYSSLKHPSSHLNTSHSCSFSHLSSPFTVLFLLLVSCSGCGNNASGPGSQSDFSELRMSPHEGLEPSGRWLVVVLEYFKASLIEDLLQRAGYGIPRQQLLTGGPLQDPLLDGLLFVLQKCRPLACTFPCQRTR